MTKSNGLLGVPLDDDRLTGHTTIMARYGSVEGAFARRILAEARTVGVWVDFIGDLDPHDLTVYLTLVCSQEAGFSRVRYFGVADEWLRLCRKYAAGGTTSSTDLPTIEMSVFEKEHFNWLLQLPLDWPRLVGVDAMNLLRSGHKLELEGATNPAFYRAGFSKQLARYLFGSTSGAIKRRVRQ